MHKRWTWVTTSLIAGLLAACAPSTDRPASTPAQPPLPAPLANLESIVGDATTVVFGEDSHGMTAVHEIVPQIFRALVERKGFRVFVFESQWATPDGLADFMNSDRTELNAIESYWLNGAFASPPIAEMLVWIRTWNRNHPDDRILLAGYQPEQPVTDFRALFDFLGEAAPAEIARLRAAVAPCRAADTATYPSEMEFLTANGRRARERQPSYTNGERAACLAGLDAIEATLRALPRPAGRAAEAARIRAGLRVASLRTYVSVIRRGADLFTTYPNMPVAEQLRLQGELYAGGDAARFHIYQALRAMDFPGRKVFHWMHNWHAFRHASETGSLLPEELTIPTGTVSFGERLARAERGALVTIGNIVPCGTTCQEPAGSLEPAFAAALGDQPVLLDLRRRSDPRLPIARPGGLYANHHRGGFANVVLRRQFDALLYIPESRIVGR